MNPRFAPIAVGKVAPAPTHIPAPRPQYLNAARAQPDHEAMEWTADYAQTMPRHIKPIDIDALTTQAERRENTVRRAVSDKHFGAAACELLEAMEKKRGTWAPMLSELAVIEFMERVEARALDLAHDEIVSKGIL